MLLILDEAFYNGRDVLFGKNGVQLLQTLGKNGARLLMIDADLNKVRRQLSESQFLTRCNEVALPSLHDRPNDISYVFLGGCLEVAKKKGLRSFECERNVLMAVVDHVLSGTEAEHSPRPIFDEGEFALEHALQDEAAQPVVRTRHLSDQWKPAAPATDTRRLTIRVPS